MKRMRRSLGSRLVLTTALGSMVLGAGATGCLDGGASDDDSVEREFTDGWTNVDLGGGYGVKRMYVEKRGDRFIGDGDIILQDWMVVDLGVKRPVSGSLIRPQGATEDEIMFDDRRWPTSFIVDPESPRGVKIRIEVPYCIGSTLARRAPDPEVEHNLFLVAGHFTKGMKIWSDALADQGIELTWLPLNKNTSEGASHGTYKPCPKCSTLYGTCGPGLTPDVDFLMIGVGDRRFKGCGTTLGKLPDDAPVGNTLRCGLAMNAENTSVQWRDAAVVHELGHALGLCHEQMRADRNLYVKLDESGEGSEEPPERFDGDWGEMRGSLNTTLGIFNTASVMLYPSSWGQGYKYDYWMRNGLEVPDNLDISVGDVNALADLYSYGVGWFNETNGGVRVAVGIGPQLPFCTTAPKPNHDPTSNIPPPRASCEPPEHLPTELSTGSRVLVEPPRNEFEWGMVADFGAWGLSNGSDGSDTTHLVMWREDGGLEWQRFRDGGFSPPIKPAAKEPELVQRIGRVTDQPLVVRPTPADPLWHSLDVVVAKRDPNSGFISDVIILPLRAPAGGVAVVENLTWIHLDDLGVSGIDRVFAGDLNGDNLPDLGFVQFKEQGQGGNISVALNSGSTKARFDAATVWATTEFLRGGGEIVKFAVADRPGQGEASYLIASRTHPFEEDAKFLSWKVIESGSKFADPKEETLSLPVADALLDFGIADMTGNGELDLVLRGTFGIWVSPGDFSGEFPFALDPPKRSEWLGGGSFAETLCPTYSCQFGLAQFEGTTQGADLVVFSRPSP